MVHTYMLWTKERLKVSFCAKKRYRKKRFKRLCLQGAPGPDHLLFLIKNMLQFLMMILI